MQRSYASGASDAPLIGQTIGASLEDTTARFGGREALVSSERYGEEIASWVVLRDDAEADPEAIRTYCRSRIARFKVPSHVKIVGEFPMTVTGKVQKLKMRDAAIEELGLERAARVETA